MIKTSITLILLQILLITGMQKAKAQVWKWANSLGSENTSTSIKNIRSYSNSDVLICGSFAASSLTLGNQTIGNSGQDDGYLAILNSEGQCTWAAGIGGANIESISDVAARANGEFAAVGSFSSIFLSIGDTNLANSGETDAFIIKFNADKSIAWTKKIGSSEIEELKSVRMDEQGGIYVSGQVIDKFSLATIYVFVRKYSPEGSLLWEKTGQSLGSYPQITGLALDEALNVYLCGGINGTITFDNTTLTTSWSNAGFIVKFSPSGVLLDTTLNFNYDKYNGIQAHQNSIYTCAEKINWGLGWGWPLSDSKIIIQKLDTDLNSIWNRETGGAEPIQSLDIARSISVDNEGNAYLTGSYFSSSLVFAGQTLINTMNGDYYYPEIFVLKYSSSGEEIWGKSLGGIHSDEGTSIYALGDDVFYLGGNFESNPASIGGFNLNNTSTLDSIYVHLRPVRYGRKPMAFVALFDIETSINNKTENQLDFNLWPNPATDILSIRCKASEFSPARVQILSADGRIVEQTDYNKASKELLIDVSKMAAGIYFITVSTELGSRTEKFIKN
jgi:hypothetical protein